MQGLVPQLMDELFNKLHQQQGNTWKVALSYWELRQNQVVDLLRANPNPAEGTSLPNEFTAVEVTSTVDVAAVLAHAHDASHGWTTPVRREESNGCWGLPRPSAAHAFVRISLLVRQRRPFARPLPRNPKRRHPFTGMR